MKTKMKEKKIFHYTAKLKEDKLLILETLKREKKKEKMKMVPNNFKDNKILKRKRKQITKFKNIHLCIK